VEREVGVVGGPAVAGLGGGGELPDRGREPPEPLLPRRRRGGYGRQLDRDPGPVDVDQVLDQSCVTAAPRCMLWRASPSCTSRRIASRTVLRDTPKLDASGTSGRGLPGGRPPRRISSRSTETTCSATLVRLRSPEMAAILSTVPPNPALSTTSGPGVNVPAEPHPARGQEIPT
jgi:hypothetical protein